jgi:O-antigen/teichoic acid export membrane protein
MSGLSSETDPDDLYWRDRGWWLRTGRSGVVLFIGTAFGFFTTVLVGRALGPENFGVLTLALVTVASLATFLDFSLEEAVMHHGARFMSERRPGAVRALLRTSLRLDALVGLVVFVVIAVFASPIAEVVSHGSVPALFVRLAALEVLAATINGTTGAALMLSGRAELRAWTLALAGLLRLGGVVVAIHVFSGGAEGVLWAYVVATAVAAMTQGWLARRLVRGLERGAHERRPVGARTLAVFGFHSSLSSSVVAARVAVVAIVLGRTAGAHDVGLLAVAMLPVTLVSVATAPLRIMMLPEQAVLAARGRLSLLWSGIRAYTWAALGFGTVAAVAGYALLPWLVPLLYSDGFRGAVQPARILLPAAVATLAVAWAKSLPAAIGRPQIRTWVSVVELLVTAGAVWLLSSHGASGAAAAISIASVTVAIAWYVIAWRMLTGAERLPDRGAENEEIGST